MTKIDKNKFFGWCVWLLLLWALVWFAMDFITNHLGRFVSWAFGAVLLTLILMALVKTKNEEGEGL